MPPGWNHSTDVYELNYRHRDNNAEEYVMKILVDLDAIIVNMLRTADNVYNDLTLEYAKEIRDCTTTFPEVYTDLTALNAAALQLTSLLARKEDPVVKPVVEPVVEPVVKCQCRKRPVPLVGRCSPLKVEFVGDLIRLENFAKVGNK